MNRRRILLYIAIAIILLGVIPISIWLLLPNKVVFHNVTFQDYDGTVLKTESVEEGKAAIAPIDPVRDGYMFIGWDSDFSNVISELVVVAQYSYINDTDPVVIVDKVTANAGDQVQVTVSLKNNPGIVGMTLRLIYDESVMMLTNVTRGAALSEMTQFVLPTDLSSGCRFPWAAVTVNFSDATNGEILILTFSISDSAMDGTYAVLMTYDSGAIVDNDLMPVPVKIQNGGITVN